MTRAECYCFFHTRLTAFRAKFVLGCLQGDHAKNNGCARTLSNTRFWLPGGKVLVVWFSAKASFQRHREPPYCKTTNYQCFPQPHTLCGNLRGFIWEKQGWTALRSGRKHLFLFLIFLIVKQSASPPGHGTHCIALAWIAYISACEVHTITSLHEAQPRLYTTGDVAGSSNTSWRNNTCEEFYCCVHFWCREREGTAGWGKGKEQIFTFWGSKATVTSVQIFYMMLLYADCSASILNNSLF